MAHGKAWMVNKKVCWPACLACSQAYEEYLRKQRYRKGSGRTDTRVRAERTQFRLLEMNQKYMISAKEMGQRTGLTDIQIGRIMRGRSAKVYTSTARKVLALYYEVTGSPPVRIAYDPRYVCSRRTRLALRGLAAQGYSRYWVREKTGLDLNTIWTITRDDGHPKQRIKIMKDTEDRVLALVREVGSRDGGNAFTRTSALNLGWKPTMYHDELV